LEPQKGAVLFASLASALKGILFAQSDRVVGMQPKHIEDNFANISEYQKELFRVHLPAFEKELNLLIKKADFLRMCLEETQVKVYKWKVHRRTKNEVNRSRFNNGDPTYTQPNQVPSQDLVPNSNATRKSYLIEIYGDISMTAKSLLRCVDEVQKELNDVPLFFETYNESIVDYNNRNGNLPLMPISHVTHLMNFHSLRDTFNDVAANNLAALQDETASKYNLALIPQTSVSVGSPSFKFSYGTRGLLHYKQKPSLEFAPGVVSLLDSYNNIVGGAAAFDKTKMSDISKDVILLSRWVTDFMYHKQALGNHDWGKMRGLTRVNSASLSNNKSQLISYKNHIQNLSCQTGKSTDQVIANNQYWGDTFNVVFISENDNVKQSIYRMISCLHTTDNKLYGVERKKFRVYNILDLNIVPINVHAMQKEIAFSNLFNYSYTFDHLVKNFIGVGLKNRPIKDVGGGIPGSSADPSEVFDNADYASTWHPEDTLVRYLIHPLGYRRIREYVNHTYRLMAGNTSLSLNKPKFLSDQLWNKVLMNTLYMDNYDQFVNEPESRDLNESRRVSAVLPNIINNNANNTSRIRNVRIVAAVQNILSDADEPIASAINIDKNNGNIINRLSFINISGVVTTTLLPPNNVPNLQRLSYEGYLRYNSRIVRWTEWFAQLQRVLRLLMRNQLEWVKDPVVQGNNAISEDVTEYKNNNVFSIGDYE
jgi:hypothetical protein